MLTPQSTSPRLLLPKPPPHGGAGDPKDALRSATGRIQAMRPGRGTIQPRARQLTPSADWNGVRAAPTLTSHAQALPGRPQRLRRPPPPPRRQWWRMWLVGRPLHSADAEDQAVGKAIGLAGFASDRPRSPPYAPPEVLVVPAAGR